MSYEDISDNKQINHKQGTISIFFRVPADSISAARSSWVDPNTLTDKELEPPLNGVIPLYIFGARGASKKQRTAASYLQNFSFISNGPPHAPVPDPDPGPAPSGYTLMDTYTTHEYRDYSSTSTPDWQDRHPDAIYTGSPFVTRDYVQLGSSGANVSPTEPSYIGVLCVPSVNGDPPKSILVVNIQMNALATITGYLTEMSSQSVSDFSWYDSSPSPSPPDWFISRTYLDVSAQALPQTETYRTVARFKDLNGAPFTGPAVTPDKWHHVIFSYDLTNTCATHGITGPAVSSIAAHRHEWVDSCPRVWMSFDDVDLKGKNLSFYYPIDHPDGQAIVTPQAYEVAGYRAASNPEQTFIDAQGVTVRITASGYPEPPTFSLSPINVPVNGHAVGIPGTSEFVNSVRHVMMAVTQVFSGVAVDTTPDQNRRLFITAQGRPTSPDVPAATLGRPDYLLATSGDWKKGKDTGSLGEAVDGTIISSGQLHPVGIIKTFHPNPKLGE